MKRKKIGFTLIELLGVIVLLSILALIAIPLVGNLIKQAKINAAVVSAYGYITAADNELLARTTRGEFVDDNTFNIIDYNIEDENLSVKYEGKGPEKGWFNIVKVKVSKGEFCINGYEIKYENGEATYVPDGELCSPPPRPLICRVKNGDLEYDENIEFEIETVEDLVCLSELVNSGYTFQGKVVTITKNIDFNNNKSYLDVNALALRDINGNGTIETVKTETTTGNGFLPIGESSSKCFKGTFNSSNFNTISNLYINRGSRDYTGLFGYLPDGAVVRGFKITNSSISGRRYVGGIVGQNFGTIKEVELFSSSVTGSGNYVGGIAGASGSSTIYKGTLAQIRVNATVNGATYVGGLAGDIEYGNTVNEVEVRGSVHGSGNYVGGIAGTTSGNWATYITMKGAIVDASVSGSSYVGGFVGYACGDCGLYGAVVGGSVTGTSNVGRSHGNGTVDIVYTSDAVTLIGSGGSNGNQYNHNYHYMGMLDDVSDSYYGGDNDKSNYYFDFDENDNYVLKRVDEHSFDTQISGSGTENDPYILASEADFKDAAILGKSGKYFRIASNLDISTFNHFYNLGTESNYFNGHLDGNNKVISNMYLNGGKNIGFIGNLNGGSVKDLIIQTSVVANRSGTNSRTGFLIGSTTGTVNVDNITIGDNQSISGQTYIGGLIGYMDGTTTVTNLHDISGLTVTGSGNYVGGLSGYITTNSSISNVKITNLTLSGSSYVGGIVGQNFGTIKEIELFSSSVTGSGNYVGGIAGASGSSTIYKGTMTQIRVNATVDGVTYVGGLAGDIEYGNTVNEVEVRGSVHGSGNYVGGIAGTTSGNWATYITMTGAIVDASVSGSSYVGGFVGYACGDCGLYGAVVGGSVTGTSNVGRSHGNGSVDKVYTSDAVTLIGSGGSNGNQYNHNYHYIGMLDDVSDTYYGGDNDKSNYYFDFDENDNYVLKRVNEHSFDTQISGSGTENDPYILASEADFKDAAILGKSGKYFRIASNLDISTFNHFYNLGTESNYFNGHLDGNNKVISNMYLNGGKNIGFIGNLNGGSVKDLIIQTSIVENKFGTNSRTGFLIGSTTGTVNVDNITIGDNQSISGQTYIGGLIGYMDGTTTVTNLHDISGLTVTGSGNYVGGLSGYITTNSSISNVKITNLTISGSAYVGGIVGQNFGTLKEIELFSSSVTGSGNYVGGIAGASGSSTIYKGTMNQIRVNATVDGVTYVGGLVGDIEYGNTVNEVEVRGSVHGSGNYVGGIAGVTTGNWATYITMTGAIVDASVSGSQYVGGFVGYACDYCGLYGAVLGGSVTGTSNVGRSHGNGSVDIVYTSDAVTLTGSGGGNATLYDDINTNLEYFASIKYNTNKPLLESSITGDINNSNYYFGYDGDGKIILVKVGSPNLTPNPPVCTENCSNPNSYPLDTISTNSGTCPDGVIDNIPPTCTFNYFVAVTNGIRASFSCTDDQSVPTIASMFNATTKEAYTYDMIIDPSRGGTVKTGTVSGNTRSVTSTWTTNYSGNKPQRGLCYYYQLAARDQCNNESNYVTTYCYYGFSNPQ